jgi:hypothetical protein
MFEVIIVMKKIVSYIIRPRSIMLTIFAIPVFIFLTVYVWWFSFTWEFVVGVTHYVTALLILISIGLAVSLIIDRKFKIQLKRYFIVALIELLFIWLVSGPIRTWQVNASFSRAKLIKEPLEKFKLQFGTYPTSLTELEEKLKQDIPHWTYVGTEYEYKQDGHGSYTLGFNSYYGYKASYSKAYDTWGLFD